MKNVPLILYCCAFLWTFMAGCTAYPLPQASQLEEHIESPKEDIMSAINTEWPYLSHIEFPHVEGRNIDGEAFILPQDFAGSYNLVLMAFAREHQVQVNSWLQRVGALEGKHAEFRVYELPTLPRMTWLQRKQLDFWMSQGISDPVARATTITLYTDMNRMREALDMADLSTIRLFLVDRQGKVYWQGQGPFAENQFQELDELLAQVGIRSEASTS